MVTSSHNPPPTLLAYLEQVWSEITQEDEYVNTYNFPQTEGAARMSNETLDEQWNVGWAVKRWMSSETLGEQ